MASRGMVTLLVSGGIALVGILLFAAGMLFMVEDVGEEDDNDIRIFSGTASSEEPSDIELSIEFEYSVYASDSISCNSIEVSVHDGTYEYFTKNCESSKTKNNLRYIGSISVDNSGTFSVESDSEVIIYQQNSDDDIDMSSLWMIVAGEGFCCLSFIGIIIAIVFIIVDKNNQNVVTIIPNHQMMMPVQQPLQNYQENDLQN
tara:strand:- start:1118 stop:1723 length:606 start_codon:yes stop_codon:yes gene_type:complete